MSSEVAADPGGHPGGAPLRVTVVGTARPTLTDLFGPAVTVDNQPLLRVVGAGCVDADLIVLHSDEPAREVAALTALAPAPPVLVVVTDRSGAQIVPALRAGATSVLVEGEYTRADLLDALHGTADGQPRLSPTAIGVVVRQVRRQEPPRERGSRQPLTRREQEIMDLVTSGHSNGQIAARLGLADKTVRNQVSRIYKKLRVRSRTEAIVDWLGRR